MPTAARSSYHRSTQAPKPKAQGKNSPPYITASTCKHRLNLIVKMWYRAVAVAAFALITGGPTHAFLSPSSDHRLTEGCPPLRSIWNNWVPRTTTNFLDVVVTPSERNNNFVVVSAEGEGQDETQRKIVNIVSTSETNKDVDPSAMPSNSNGHLSMAAAAIFFVAAAAGASVFSPEAAYAVSGGGLDYASQDISNEDFSNGNYKGKDFTQVIARNTKFNKSNLQGCRFQKAYLIEADFSDADLRGVSMESSNLEKVSLKNANAAGAYFTETILDASNLENIDFTDAQMPPKVIPKLCDRDDLKGTNPLTGNDTRDSLMCP